MSIKRQLSVSVGMKHKKEISWQLPQLEWIPCLKAQLLTFLKTLKLEEESLTKDIAISRTTINNTQC